MSVYKNIKVAIPSSGVTIERRSNGAPALIKYVLSVDYHKVKKYPIPKRVIIGHQCLDDSTKMFPTTKYKDVFPEQWTKVSGETVKPAAKRIGLHALCDAVNKKTEIKNILEDVYGIDTSNALIDFAMYSILHKSDVLNSFAGKMNQELLFSGNARSDSYYSDLFENQMSKEEGYLFQKQWIKKCKEQGVESVWLCIDGSNDDCRSKGVEIAEKGKAKSGNNVNIVSFTYAVTETGLPVAFDVYQGGLVDAKAMRKVINFLLDCDITIKGVILDRGYCSSKSISYLRDNNIPYIIMVKGNPIGCSTLIKEYGNKIKMNAEYLVNGTHLFGVQKQISLFEGCDYEDFVTLFFDYQNGSERITTLLDNLYEEIDQANRLLLLGEQPQISSRYAKMISVIKADEEKNILPHAKINTLGLQKALDEKGLYSIVSSLNLTPQNIHALYVARDVSETQFMFIKNQLGYGKVRLQSTAGVYAKFLTAFIAATIRYELWQASKTSGKTTTQMISEISQLEMVKINDVYTYVHVEKERIKKFFKTFDIDTEKFFDDIVNAENDRLSGKVPTIRHRKTGPKKGSHHKQYDENGNIIPRKKGVKVGTKRSDFNKDGSPRKKPGVQVGTKRGVYNKDGSLRKKSGPKTEPITQTSYQLE